MSSGVMNLKRFLSIVRQTLRAIIPTGHTFEGHCTARLTSLDTAIGGSSKDGIILYIVRIFRSLEPVKRRIIPLKVLLALKGEAK